MMKKIISLCMAILFAMTVVGQTVSIDDQTESPGNIAVEVIFNGFTPEVGSVDLAIAYDTDLLTYTGNLFELPTGVLTFNPDFNGKFLLQWWSETGETIDGTFITIYFDYKGGFENDFAFDQNLCQIADVDADPIPGVIYDDGLLTPDLSNPDGTAILGSVEGIAGASVSVPVNINDIAGGFHNVASSMSLFIAYDTDKLEYTGVTDNSLDFAVSEADGVIHLAKTTLTPLSFPLTDPVINLTFDYLGGGTADVAWKSGSVITDDEGTILITSFTDGSVDLELPPGAGFLTIAKVTSPGATYTLPGPTPQDTLWTPAIVEVPITAEDLSGTDAGAITLKIGYDDEKLDYTGYSSATFPTGWTVAQSAGLLTFSRTDNLGITLNDGEVLKLEFDYFNGVADITFEAGTLLTDVNGEPIPVGLEDGYVTPPVYVNTKVYLQGPWNGTTMNTTLLNNNVIPLAHPYGVSPWNYGGNESVGSVPANVVDWILIELRTGTAASTMVAQRAGFLLNNGSVVDLVGTSMLEFGDGLLPGDYFIVVKHRNHLAIMSADAQPLNNASDEYDFTDAEAKSYYDSGIGLPAVKDLGGGKWGMIGGDGDSDGKTFISDVFGVWFPDANLIGVYKAGDYNLNSNLFIADVFGIWSPNANLFTHVPN